MIDNWPTWPTIRLKIMKPHLCSNTQQWLSNGMKAAPRISLDLICEHQLNFQWWKYSNCNDSCIACLNLTKSSLWFEVSCMDTKHKKPLCEQKDMWTNIRLNKQHHGTQQTTWHMNMITFPIGRTFVKSKIQWIILLSSICEYLILCYLSSFRLHCNPKSIPIQIFFVTHFVFRTPNSHKMRYSQILTKFWLLTAISQNHRTKFEP